jgi:hypothetical protein
MAKNQWVMFDTQEDAVLDALFRLRTLNNSVVSVDCGRSLTAGPWIHERAHVAACRRV